MLQLLIKNGTIIDPANKLRGVFDIAAIDGKIAAISPKIDAPAVNEADASG